MWLSDPFYECKKRGKYWYACKRGFKGKTTTVAGPSGVGKSSLINILQPEAKMETGEISKKIAAESIRQDIRN